MDIVLQEKIKQLQKELSSLLPLTPEQQHRLNEKLNLEFNYNSNHIEGNTLTYSETKQFLLFEETRGNHTLREYEEMKASEIALQMVKELAAEKERPLTETFIKNLNKILLVQPYWTDAQTPDGHATRRKILVGDYKQQPNSVILQSGKIFDYASPAETPMLMGDMLEWYKTEKEKGELHPIELAALLHYRFVRIHPFDDGNGRISRLLLNYVLYNNQLPPVIIKSADKPAYLRALHDADSGNTVSFINYIGEQLLWSLELSISAAKNDPLEEAEDWKKKLDVLKKDLDRRDGIENIVTIDVIINLINNSLIPLIDKIYIGLNGVADFFMKTAVSIQETTHRYIELKRQDPDDIEKYYEDHFLVSLGFFDFKKNGDQPFNIIVSLNFYFNPFHFDIFIDNTKFFTKLYHQSFTQTETETFTNACGKILYEKIEAAIAASHS